MPIMHKRWIQLLRIGNQTLGAPRLAPGLLHILHLLDNAPHNLISGDCCVDAQIADTGTRKRSRSAAAIGRRRRLIASIGRSLNGLNEFGDHGHNRLQKRLQSHRGKIIIRTILIHGTKRRGTTTWTSIITTALALSLLLDRCLFIRKALDHGGNPENIAAHMLPRFEKLSARADGDHISIVIGVGKDHLRQSVGFLGRKSGAFDAQKVLGEGKEFLVRELVLVVQEALYWDPADFRSIAKLDDAVGGWAPKVGSGGRVGIR
mmetsp:Transcript_1905/g.3011  ORF Transcript_1905/g.3011 Transcript_1905/m.3011 type:complete len:262 (+) Transcript_1905:372-1157(+)